jgi:hypothetical protein
MSKLQSFSCCRQRDDPWQRTGGESRGALANMTTSLQSRLTHLLKFFFHSVSQSVLLYRIVLLSIQCLQSLLKLVLRLVIDLASFLARFIEYSLYFRHIRHHVRVVHL